MNATLTALSDEILQKAAGGASSAQEREELTLMVEKEHLLDVLGLLRDDEAFGFIILLDICGVDWPGRVERFDVVYHLLAPKRNVRVRVKIRADEVTSVPSVCNLFPCANWYEREAWDMYGIVFEGHPDLRRILTDYGFEGHPLRKDFPLTGFVELRYDDAVKRVVYEPVELKQEYRDFDFLSPWDSTPSELPGDEKATPTIDSETR
ncbi:NADH-quinone oxidoreductase subunit C [Rhizobium cauense]|uniref:NADH-quinone oxidoreductase subunit C n=1 Tax=Rhizobium cauense TaxID=1166683 RepID=UPI001C6F1E63|nr:NADH-quinone oxidoreductase subunit C [Rhizobium cauense]MBW9117657.1 NADH-quinone oxidoreductase subunit C [Rhizobium cauense]